MLTEICENLHNFFDKSTDPYTGMESGTTVYYGEYFDRNEDDFTISTGGVISPLPSTLVAGQYIRIVGSKLNDGIYLLSGTLANASLVNETFHGVVYGLRIPRDLVTLDTEITAWVAANPATLFASESFGGWSGSRATGRGGVPLTWEKVYAARLNRWRKI
jgi:hypothetical protein